jgi:hypothetical protein
MVFDTGSPGGPAVVRSRVQVDLHGQAKAGDFGQLNRAAINGDEAIHDRQSQPATG